MPIILRQFFTCDPGKSCSRLFGTLKFGVSIGAGGDRAVKTVKSRHECTVSNPPTAGCVPGWQSGNREIDVKLLTLNKWSWTQNNGREIRYVAIPDSLLLNWTLRCICLYRSLTLIVIKNRVMEVCCAISLQHFVYTLAQQQRKFLMNWVAIN